MAELKTRPTRRSALTFLRKVDNATRRTDALALLELFRDTTGEPAVMWGESIVGFGRYHYRQKSGQPAMWPLTGFSPRRQHLVVYIMPGFGSYKKLLARLGKHRTATSCLYINKLADIDVRVLQQLIRTSVKDMQRLYPETTP